MGMTFEELFTNPPEEFADAVAKEKAAAFEELDLIARGLMTIDARGEQPDSPIHSDAGAQRRDVPLSGPDKENR